MNVNSTIPNQPAFYKLAGFKNLLFYESMKPAVKIIKV